MPHRAQGAVEVNEKQILTEVDIRTANANLLPIILERMLGGLPCLTE